MHDNRARSRGVIRIRTVKLSLPPRSFWEGIERREEKSGGGNFGNFFVSRESTLEFIENFGLKLEVGVQGGRSSCIRILCLRTLCLR